MSGNCQLQADVLTEQLAAGTLGRAAFAERMDQLYQELPPAVRHNLDFRMDRSREIQGRSLGDFALAIYDTTQRERVFIDAWAAKHGVLETRDGGMDNRGGVIFNPRHVNRKADFWVRVGKRGPDKMPPGWHKLEVKFCPCLHKATYKVADLRAYAAANAFVLTVWSDGKMIGTNGDRYGDGQLQLPTSGLHWSLFSPVDMGYLLRLPHQNRREVGYKPAVQLGPGDIAYYLHPWEE